MDAVPEDIQWCHDRLTAYYGNPPMKPRRDPLETLMRTILSQNTSDVNRDKAYQSLKGRFPSWDSVKAAEPQEIATAIRSGGLANQKTERIRRVLTWLEQRHGSLDLSWICEENPDQMIDLFTRIKGIGVKTISIVLCFSCRQDIFPVDTHVNRVCRRLGLVPEKASPEKTFWLMKQVIPAEISQPLHLNMIRHGRQICKSRQPTCNDCVLLEHCEYGLQNQ